jgi:hypothetical protein
MSHGNASNIEVSLSEKVKFTRGDVIKLRDKEYSITVGFYEGSKCAVPGFNCGSGYRPPHVTFMVNCGTAKVCPYIHMAFSNSSTTGTISIEDLKSCETHEPERCFREFAEVYKEDKGCMNISNFDGRYYCLKKFEYSKMPENKNLCDLLSDSVYALKWNCFYEYAIRYNDQSICDKYPSKEVDGRNRCLLKMAELAKDKSICKKIIKNSQDTYLEQCFQIK